MTKKTQMPIARPSKKTAKATTIEELVGSKKAKKTQLLIETTPEFKSRVKAYCANNDETVKDFIHRLIEQELIR